MTELEDAESHGVATEKHVREVAATLGLSDFVYRAQLVQKGGGNREPGDAILFANGLGAIVQVKSREPAAAAADSPERVQRWIDKHGAKAVKQAHGTRRELCRLRDLGASPLALPVRAAHLPEDQQRLAGLPLAMDTIESWPTIIVLDHPLVGDAVSPLPNDVFWITLPDWAELHRATRSTTGLLTYVTRVIAADPTPNWVLGRENDRFAEFVAADSRASNSGAGFFNWSTLEESEAVDAYRSILDRVWPQSGQLPAVPINEYRLIVEHLDGMPPGAAAQIGQWISGKIEAANNERTWVSGCLIVENRLTVFAADQRAKYEDVKYFTSDLMALVTLRTRQIMSKTSEAVNAGAIGLLIDGSNVDYVFALSTKPLDMPRELKRELEERYGVFDVQTGALRFPD